MVELKLRLAATSNKNETRVLLKDVVIDSGPSGPVPDNSWGEPGLTAAENVYAWNNFCVLAMTSGNPARPVNAVLLRRC